VAEGQDDNEKTEDPTQRRIEKAIEKGDVARSIEVNTWFILAAFALAVIAFSGSIARELALALKGQFMNAHLVPPDAGGLAHAARNGLDAAMAALALPFALLVLASLAGGLIQHAPLWTTGPLKPQISRISPLAGFKRVFGKEALAQFLKGLVKIGAVGAIVGSVLWGERDRFDALVRLDVASLLPATRTMLMDMLGGVIVLLAFVAVGDYLYQRMTWLRRQRMSKRELKEEFKETEGNPEVRNRFKQLRQARVKKRMMAAVPKATVVIVNPTHFAVALQYELGMPAPYCVAKGVDALALRIRAVAEEHGVPVVESPPLARALHAAVDIDEEIPVEHYKAVAEVIGYVLRLRGRAA